MPPLFGLAPGGVCRAASVTSRAVRSYRTLSPLPVFPKEASAVCSLWHFPWGHPRRTLSGTVVSVEPGLSSRAKIAPAAARPSGPAALVVPLRLWQQQREQDHPAFCVNLSVNQFGAEPALERHDGGHRFRHLIAEPF